MKPDIHGVRSDSNGAPDRRPVCSDCDRLLVDGECQKCSAPSTPRCTVPVVAPGHPDCGRPLPCPLHPYTLESAAEATRIREHAEQAPAPSAATPAPRDPCEKCGHVHEGPHGCWATLRKATHVNPIGEFCSCEHGAAPSVAPEPRDAPDEEPCHLDPSDYLDCPNCGDCAIEADKHHHFHDGQEGICPGCGARCVVSCDSESEPYVNHWTCRHGTDGDDPCAKCEEEGTDWQDMAANLAAERATSARLREERDAARRDYEQGQVKWTGTLHALAANIQSRKAAEAEVAALRSDFDALLEPVRDLEEVRREEDEGLCRLCGAVVAEDVLHSFTCPVPAIRHAVAAFESRAKGGGR